MGKIVLLSLYLFIFASSLQAQDSLYYVDVTTAHWNLGLKENARAEWLELEKEYFEKVTRKNEYIIASWVLLHHFTEDNTEIKFVTVYKSWSDIETSNGRSGELIKKGWPDKDKKNEFFKKQSSYISNLHSDEIFTTVTGGKALTEKRSEPLIFYKRTSKLAFPPDGKTDELYSMLDEYRKAAIIKNEYIKAYHPLRHFWGADGRDFVEFFVVNSLADIEKSFVRTNELIATKWPKAEDKKLFFDTMSKYFTGEHGDYIYLSVPALTK